MTVNWEPLVGKFEVKKKEIIFKGEPVTFSEEVLKTYNVDPQREFGTIGLIMSNIEFKGGDITAEVEFQEVTDSSCCEIIIFHDVSTGYLITAGLGGTFENMYTIRNRTDKSNWLFPALAGSKLNLEKGKKYLLNVKVQGSVVDLYVNGVKVLTNTFPFNIPNGQVGIWCIDKKNIIIRNIETKTKKQRAFAIIPFSSPYLEIYEMVIKKVAEEFDLEVKKADEQYSPGQIIEDIERDISESDIIIADVSSDSTGKFNPNVYYEVGFARKGNKFPILLAEKNTVLPFDIHGFRTIFYSDSIVGKEDLEDKLRKYIKEVLNRGIRI